MADIDQHRTEERHKETIVDGSPESYDRYIPDEKDQKEKLEKVERDNPRPDDLREGKENDEKESNRVKNRESRDSRQYDRRSPERYRKGSLSGSDEDRNRRRRRDRRDDDRSYDRRRNDRNHSDSEEDYRRRDDRDQRYSRRDERGERYSRRDDREERNRSNRRNDDSRKEEDSKREVSTKKETKDSTQNSVPQRKKEPLAEATKTGGVYIPPFKLAQMLKEVNDKSSMDYQRMTWDALKKSINGLVNKINVSNVTNILPELFSENLVRGKGLFARSCMKSQMASPTFTHVFAALVAVVNTKFPDIGRLLLTRIILQFRRAFKRNDKVVKIP